MKQFRKVERVVIKPIIEYGFIRRAPSALSVLAVSGRGDVTYETV